MEESCHLKGNQWMLIGTIKSNDVGGGVHKISVLYL